MFYYALKFTAKIKKLSLYLLFCLQALVIQFYFYCFQNLQLIQQKPSCKKRLKNNKIKNSKKICKKMRKVSFTINEKINSQLSIEMLLIKQRLTSCKSKYLSMEMFVQPRISIPTNFLLCMLMPS